MEKIVFPLLSGASLYQIAWGAETKRREKHSKELSGVLREGRPDKGRRTRTVFSRKNIHKSWGRGQAR